MSSISTFEGEQFFPKFLITWNIVSNTQVK